MGALDNVHAIGLGNPLWTVTGPAVLVGGLEGDRARPVAGLAGTSAVAVGSAGKAVAIEERNSAMGLPGDPRASDPAWMPPLTELPDRAFQYQIELCVDQETGRVVARVIDRESGEVVRQVPPEYVLQLAMYIDEWLGRVLDARA